ncbi:sialate O-acetylesterase [Sphingomonas morindae]|uniref:Sialate O-acetylesterase n=1 Tax=Sphingomonas morindae TaxID=1541170 RepID=A0ABY4XCZ3_9SPHN|nr:sialate O-acetylesterase [Sphingomonas morindae]USI74772.1 sialate O-acetylesterase [Sphingomonas morindae]
MKFGLFTALAAALSAPAAAELRVPHLFSDHAVLQRDRPLHVWGWATPGAQVTVSLHTQQSRATADRLGRWDGWLMPEPAGGPYDLTITGDGAEGSRHFADIMIGDVWFASGQSNMEMPLAGFPPSAHVAHAAEEIAHAGNPRIRLLRIDHRSSPFPLDDIEAGWTPSTPDTAKSFSAIGYFFAREIAAREHVTVGVIDSAWGGTPADSWVSMEAFGADPRLLPAFAARARLAEDETRKDALLAAEAREDAAARQAGRPVPAHDWHPPQESWTPAGLYNAMVAPFTGYQIKGVLWYQGETNSKVDRAPFYADLFQGLITDWRHGFGQGDFPFLFAQISSFDSPRENWGMVRDAQRRALGLANTAMAVTTDVGDPTNVHPSDKQTVAARLARAARGLAYGEAIAYQPPLYRQLSGVPGGLRVWFDHGEGLTSRGAPVTGFEIAGADHRFVPATARIEKDSVVVTGAVPEPVYVRYNWSNVTPGALYNAAGLPASTFTSEERIAGHLAFP